MSIAKYINYAALGQLLAAEFSAYNWRPWQAQLSPQVAAVANSKRYGDLPKWQAIIEQMPQFKSDAILLDAPVVSIGEPTEIDAATNAQIKNGLLALSPWRKGPFRVFDTSIDAEWRSDMKWQRLAKKVQLRGHKVLDVGCGNGYYMLRMLGAGAKMVLGIDPNPRFLLQFYSLLNFYKAQLNCHILPLGIEDLPPQMPWFDSVFSMGVLYHRRSPIEHLEALWAKLRPGGQLVLETLVVNGDSSTVLVPPKRYAMMRNVWFLPALDALKLWLVKVGFTAVQIIDHSTTTIDEQRQTKWMQYHSLANFLDPNDSSLTIEQHPRPQRAILLAIKP